MTDVLPPTIDNPGRQAPADLYFRTRSRGLEYRRFESTAAAIDFARNTLSPREYNTSVIESADLRLQVDEQGACVRTSLEGRA